jgi:hypothetical protein
MRRLARTAMRDRDLFQLALVLRPFWQVVSCEFDLGKKRLDIEIDFPPGSIFICPGCGREGCKAYDKEAAYTIKRHWNGILRGLRQRSTTASSRESTVSSKLPKPRPEDPIL